MQKYDLKDYGEQLEQLCTACRKYEKCKDRTKICMLKKFAFTLAKTKLKKQEKKGIKFDESC